MQSPWGITASCGVMQPPTWDGQTSDMLRTMVVVTHRPVRGACWASPTASSSVSSSAGPAPSTSVSGSSSVSAQSFVGARHVIFDEQHRQRAGMAGWG